MPKTQDLVIFVPIMTTTTDGQTNCFISCACTQGNDMDLHLLKVEASEFILGIHAPSSTGMNQTTYLCMEKGSQALATCGYRKTKARLRVGTVQPRLSGPRLSGTSIIRTSQRHKNILPRMRRRRDR